ncbi:hypothetical protein [Gillisia xinjiangensis]|uniref:hypothetical protein n=1 Tax=Gillisia xinjiangensis TaxID=3384765 RepID=UPI003918AED9
MKILLLKGQIYYFGGVYTNLYRNWLAYKQFEKIQILKEAIFYRLSTIYLVEYYYKPIN